MGEYGAGRWTKSARDAAESVVFGAGGGEQYPSAASAIAGGTVIRPTLKQTSVMTTQWRVAPSGSSRGDSVAIRLVSAAS